MELPKGRSNLQTTVRDNLTDHRYAQFIDRPTWPYIGPSRLDNRGDLKPEGAFSITRVSSMRGLFVWSMDLQGEAVIHGFFLHRSGHHNRVNIISTNHQYNFNFDSSDGFEAVTWLERRAFTDWRSPIFQQALDFIKQQDQFGYSGAWDRRVQFWSNGFKWYRVWTAMRKPANKRTRLDKQILAEHEKRVQSATQAQPWAYGVYLNNHWINPETGKPKPHTKPAPVKAKSRVGRSRANAQTKMDMKWPGQDAAIGSVEVKRPRSKVPLSSMFRKRPTEVDD